MFGSANDSIQILYRASTSRHKGDWSGKKRGYKMYGPSYRGVHFLVNLVSGTASGRSTADCRARRLQRQIRTARRDAPSACDAVSRRTRRQRSMPGQHVLRTQGHRAHNLFTILTSDICCHMYYYFNYYSKNFQLMRKKERKHSQNQYPITR